MRNPNNGSGTVSSDGGSVTSSTSLSGSVSEMSQIDSLASGGLSLSSSSSSLPPQASTSTSRTFLHHVKTQLRHHQLSRSTLFRDTSKALSEQKVIGVFPEGTSYTQASIVQVMPGAAWAAVEYMRYVAENGHGESGLERSSKKGKEKEKAGLVTGLSIIPVAIVYTDKSRYLSRIYVRYGEPISIDEYTDDLLSGEDPDESSKSVVKKIMQRVEKQMRDMTINAPDWDTLCAVSMARTILWEDEKNVPLKHWVEVSQRLVEIFTSSTDQSVKDLKNSLTTYHSLLHYSNVKHPVLQSLIPISFPTPSTLLDILSPNSISSSSILLQPTLSLLHSLPLSLLRFILFIPPLIVHLPGYFTGPLLSKLLATPGEEEGPAQFKSVGAGIGIGLNILLAMGMLWRKSGFEKVEEWLGLGKLVRGLSLLVRGATWGTVVGKGDGECWIAMKRMFGLVGTVYVSMLVLVKWHKLLVGANYRELQRFLTYRKLFSAFAFSSRRRSISTTSIANFSSDELTPTEVEAYTRPPLPAANIFINKRNPESNASTSTSTSSFSLSSGEEPNNIRAVPPPVSSTRLMGHLLRARVGALVALSSYFGSREHETLLNYLVSKGAKM